MTIATISFEGQDSDVTAGARSYVYRLLADAFSFPAEPLAEALSSGDWSDQISALAEHLPYELSCPLLPEHEVAPAILQQDYVTTFEVGVGRPFCPLYEGSHRSGRMKLMEDIVRFYEHFGLKPQPGDQPDHLCAEFEFMHYLAFKEAVALAHSDPVTDVRLAQLDFLQRHLCKWLPRLRARLQSGEEPARFYMYALDVATEFCRSDLAWLKAA